MSWPHSYKSFFSINIPTQYNCIGPDHWSLPWSVSSWPDYSSRLACYSEDHKIWCKWEMYYFQSMYPLLTMLQYLLSGHSSDQPEHFYFRFSKDYIKSSENMRSNILSDMRRRIVSKTGNRILFAVVYLRLYILPYHHHPHHYQAFHQKKQFCHCHSQLIPSYLGC